MNTTPAPRPLLARAADAVIEASVVASFSRLGPLVRSRLFAWDDPPRNALAGRTAVVTGATSGIGLALAEGMAGLGATVHLVGRDAGKLRHAVDHVVSRVPSADAVGEHADLAVLDDVRALAARLTERHGHLDIVAHVAGALAGTETRTTDGIETTLQVHVVAPFLLTSLLLPLLIAAPDARVLTMSSGGMYTQRLDVDDLVHPGETFNGTIAYARAKRAQVELNAMWAARHRQDRVGFHAMHPGWVDTPGLHAGLPSFTRWARPALRSTEQGADTALWLSWTPDATAPGGDFWLDRRRRHTVALPWTRTPDGETDRLWRTTAALAGIEEVAP